MIKKILLAIFLFIPAINVFAAQQLSCQDVVNNVVYWMNEKPGTLAGVGDVFIRLEMPSQSNSGFISVMEPHGTRSGKISGTCAMIKSQPTFVLSGSTGKQRTRMTFTLLSKNQAKLLGTFKGKAITVNDLKSVK